MSDLSKEQILVNKIMASGYTPETMNELAADMRAVALITTPPENASDIWNKLVEKIDKDNVTLLLSELGEDETTLIVYQKLNSSETLPKTLPFVKKMLPIFIKQLSGSLDKEHDIHDDDDDDQDTAKAADGTARASELYETEGPADTDGATVAEDWNGPQENDGEQDATDLGNSEYEEDENDEDGEIPPLEFKKYNGSAVAQGDSEAASNQNDELEEDYADMPLLEKVPRKTLASDAAHTSHQDAAQHSEAGASLGDAEAVSLEPTGAFSYGTFVEQRASAQERKNPWDASELIKEDARVAAQDARVQAKEQLLPSIVELRNLARKFVAAESSEKDKSQEPQGNPLELLGKLNEKIKAVIKKFTLKILVESLIDAVAKKNPLSPNKFEVIISAVFAVIENPENNIANKQRIYHEILTRAINEKIELEIATFQKLLHGVINNFSQLDEKDKYTAGMNVLKVLNQAPKHFKELIAKNTGGLQAIVKFMASEMQQKSTTEKCVAIDQIFSLLENSRNLGISFAEDPTNNIENKHVIYQEILNGAINESIRLQKTTFEKLLQGVIDDFFKYDKDAMYTAGIDVLQTLNSMAAGAPEQFKNIITNNTANLQKIVTFLAAEMKEQTVAKQYAAVNLISDLLENSQKAGITFEANLQMSADFTRNVHDLRINIEASEVYKATTQDVVESATPLDSLDPFLPAAKLIFKLCEKVTSKDFAATIEELTKYIDEIENFSSVITTMEAKDVKLIQNIQDQLIEAKKLLQKGKAVLLKENAEILKEQIIFSYEMLKDLDFFPTAPELQNVTIDDLQALECTSDNIDVLSGILNALYKDISSCAMNYTEEEASAENSTLALIDRICNEINGCVLINNNESGTYSFIDLDNLRKLEQELGKLLFVNIEELAEILQAYKELELLDTEGFQALNAAKETLESDKTVEIRILPKLFDQLKTEFKKRSGDYTRILQENVKNIQQSSADGFVATLQRLPSAFFKNEEILRAILLNEHFIAMVKDSNEENQEILNKIVNGISHLDAQYISKIAEHLAEKDPAIAFDIMNKIWPTLVKEFVTNNQQNLPKNIEDLIDTAMQSFSKYFKENGIDAEFNYKALAKATNLPEFANFTYEIENLVDILVNFARLQVDFQAKMLAAPEHYAQVGVKNDVIGASRPQGETEEQRAAALLALLKAPLPVAVADIQPAAAEEAELPPVDSAAIEEQPAAELDPAPPTITPLVTPPVEQLNLASHLADLGEALASSQVSPAANSAIEAHTPQAITPMITVSAFFAKHAELEEKIKAAIIKVASAQLSPVKRGKLNDRLASLRNQLKTREDFVKTPAGKREGLINSINVQLTAIDADLERAIAEKAAAAARNEKP